MQRRNYWCVQSPNISVDVAKCGENFHKLNQHTHSLSVTNNDLSWQKNLIMVMFQLMSMSSYDNNKLHFCSVTQHQCRHHQMWGKLSQIHPLHSHFICYKNELSCLNNLFIIRLQLIRMSSYAKTKLQMCSVTQHQCRCRQMWSKVSQIHRVHSLLRIEVPVTKRLTYQSRDCRAVTL